MKCLKQHVDIIDVKDRYVSVSHEQPVCIDLIRVLLCLILEFRGITFKTKFCVIMLCSACNYWAIVYLRHLSIAYKTWKDKDYMESFRLEMTLKIIESKHKPW